MADDIALPGFEEIWAGEMLIAMLICAGFKLNSTRFFSPPAYSQQLGILCYPKVRPFRPPLSACET